MSVGPGTYQLSNAVSGTAIDRNGSDANVKTLIGYSVNNGPNQHWIVEDAGNGQVTLKNAANEGEYIGAPAGVENGSPLEVVDQGNALKFEISAEGDFHRVHVAGTKYVIDLDGAGNGQANSADGAKIQLWGSYAAGKNQTWKFAPV